MKGCSEEFKLSNFYLNHPKPSLFVTSQWSCIPQVVFLVYRVFFALVFTVWIILSGAWPYDWYIGEENRIKWFIYLTNWAFFALTVSSIAQASLSLHYYVMARTERGNITHMRWYYKATWVLYNIAIGSGLAVTLLFWIVIYSPSYNVHPVDWHTHLTNSLYIIMDMFITALPVRILHFFHGLTFTLVYILFSVIYDLSGGTNGLEQDYIYSPLDWSGDPGTATLYAVLAGLVGSNVVWLILYALYRARLAVYMSCCKPQMGDDTDHVVNQNGLSGNKVGVEDETSLSDVS